MENIYGHIFYPQPPKGGSVPSFIYVGVQLKSPLGDLGVNQK
jgi:hypothetical protein